MDEKAKNGINCNTYLVRQTHVHHGTKLSVYRPMNSRIGREKWTHLEYVQLRKTDASSPGRRSKELAKTQKTEESVK